MNLDAFVETHNSRNAVFMHTSKNEQVVKVTTSPPDGRFNRIRQVAPMCPHGKAHWHHLANTIELVLPSATQVHNPNGKSIGSAVAAQPLAESPYTLQRATLSPKIAASQGGSGPNLTHDSLGPSEPTNQTASVSVQPFLHR